MISNLPDEGTPLTFQNPDINTTVIFEIFVVGRYPRMSKALHFVKSSCGHVEFEGRGNSVFRTGFLKHQIRS